MTDALSRGTHGSPPTRACASTSACASTGARGTPSPESILSTLRSHRFLLASERDLHAGIASALTAAGADVALEVPLNRRDRIDLLVGRVGIEVKVSGAWREVERQLCRYLESPLLDDLVLVTVKAMHGRIPQGTVTLQSGERKRLFVHHVATSGL